MSLPSATKISVAVQLVVLERALDVLDHVQENFDVDLHHGHLDCDLDLYGRVHLDRDHRYDLRFLGETSHHHDGHVHLESYEIRCCPAALASVTPTAHLEEATLPD
jgi:hypothetical protein